jgi:hypothetical protein
VIDEDGRCKECGRSNAAGESVVPSVVPVTAATSTADDEDFDSRQLCSDGSCTGLIGPDGHCKECGKPS